MVPQCGPQVHMAGERQYTLPSTRPWLFSMLYILRQVGRNQKKNDIWFRRCRGRSFRLETKCSGSYDPEYKYRLQECHSFTDWVRPKEYTETKGRETIENESKNFAVSITERESVQFLK